MKELSEKSKEYKLGLYVFKNICVLREDFLLYGSNMCASYNSVVHLLKNMLERGLVCLGSVRLGPQRHRKANTVTVCITAKGFAYYLEELPPEKMKAHKKMYDLLNGVQEKKKVMHLIDTHIQAMFLCADIPTGIYDDKPTLNDIHNLISMSDREKSNLKYQMLIETFNRGVYYNKDEFRRWYRETYVDDEIFASVFRGIFLSTDKCIVIYSNGKNNNNMIYCSSIGAEYKLLEKLKLEFKYTSISALTMSDTESFVYSTAEARTKGRHKDDEQSANNGVIKILNQNTMKFDKFYCCVYGKDNIKTLSSILNYYESIEADHYVEISKAIDFSNVDSPLKYKDLNGIWQACYILPFYELNTLMAIRKAEDTPVIITREHLIETIQHITHKRHIFLDADTLEVIDNNALIYDSKGNPLGVKILLDYLHEQKLTIKPKQLTELPKKNGYSYNYFYNKIAQGELDIEQLVNDIETIEFQNKRKYKTNRKRIDVSDEIYNQIKSYASEHNITMFNAVRKIFEQLDISTQDGIDE